MIKNRREPLLLFDSVHPEEKEGEFSRWMRYQKNNACSGHTLITTFNINYEFVSKALNGLFFNKHECTILRSGFSGIRDSTNIDVLNNINIYPYQKNKKTHAKAIISVSDDSEPQYFIAFGSANATYGGLGGNNLELIEAFSNFKRLKRLNPISKSIKEYLIETFLPVIADELEGLSKRKIKKIATSLKKVKAKGEWPKIIDNQKRAIASQMLKTKGRKNSSNDLHILSPYHGTTSNPFDGCFMKPKWIIGNGDEIIQKSETKYNFHRLKADDRNLHAKAYLIKQKTYKIYYGSANCSENALCKTVGKNGGQLEILLSREIKRSEYVGIIEQYLGEKAKLLYAKGSDFKEDEIDDSQLFCINVVTREQARFITLITAKLNIKSAIEIAADRTNWVSVSPALLNKEISVDGKSMQKFAHLFEGENPKWVYQRIRKGIIPVPVNYEGALSYSMDVNSLEDEIIYCLSKQPRKSGKSKKQRIPPEDSIQYSSLTHESDLDIWFKKIKRINEIRDKNKRSNALEDIEEYIKLLKEKYRTKEKYKYNFLEGYFSDGN